MRLLLVYPGALFSTMDVARGYHKAFKRRDDTQLFSFQFEKYLAYHKYGQMFVQGKDFNNDEVIKSASKDVLVRILECRPDWVIFVSGIAFPTFVWDYVKQLQEDLKRPFKAAVLLTESPYVESWEEGILERVNMAFTMDYGSLEDYRKINPNTHYVGHSYDPEIHFRSGQPKTIDAFMVATGFPERQRLLEAINWDDINLELYGNWMYMGTSSLAQYLRGQNLKNEEAAEKYRMSKLGLNIFRTVQWPDANPKFIEPNKAKSMSPRCYEAMACGAMLLTDWREELDILPKDSCVLWGDAKDLEEKMRWYLSHDAERERIAQNGFDAIQDDTFDKRANEILTHMGE